MRPVNLLRLTRFGLSVAIAFSAVAGEILYSHSFNMITLYTFIGVTLLSAGASALNQYQERDLDAKMGRTIKRPLPSGQIQPGSALKIAFVLAITGTLILFFKTTLIAAILGVFNLLWYNLVYTPLKTRNRFVLLIGALTGAVPPLIGWTASGGSISDTTIISVAFFMFLWQIPHFWLILLKYGKEYESAGFSPIALIALKGNIKPILFIWVISTSVSSLFFPYFNVISSFYLVISLIVINFLLIISFYQYLFKKKRNLKSAFRSIYLYQVIVLLVLIIEALWTA